MGTPSHAPAAALVALHYQNDVLHPDGRIRVGLDGDTPRRTALIAAAQALLRGARERRLPIVHVRVAYSADGSDLLLNAPIFRSVAASQAVVEGSWGAAFFEGLAPEAGSAQEFVVRHQRVNAFHGSLLDEVLRMAGARHLIVAGVATHSVVESTVRHAVDAGYEVTVAADACASADPAAHEASLRSMALIARISPTGQVFA